MDDNKSCCCCYKESKRILPVSCVCGSYYCNDCFKKNLFNYDVKLGKKLKGCDQCCDFEESDSSYYSDSDDSDDSEDYSDYE